jgi:aldehyde dehydrogenase (NAD+)
MATTEQTITRDKLFIGGEWVDPTGSGTIEVVNPSNEEVIGSIPEGSAEDVDRAARAAREAFATWSQTTPAERAAVLGAIGAGLNERGDEIAGLVATELGMPLKLARMIQAGLPTMTFSSMPELM